MPLTFPLSRDDFARKLRIVSAEFRLEEYLETSGTAMGQMLTAQIAAPKWRAEVSMTPMLLDDSEGIQAIIEAIGPHERFHIFNPRRPYPKSDPDGSILGSATPSILAIGSDNRSLRLQGLPPNYRLSAGDMLSLGFSGRQALHRIVEDINANSGGNTLLFEVRPHLKAGTTVGEAITLTQPWARMQMLPGSFNPGRVSGQWVSGMSFSAIESFR